MMTSTRHGKQGMGIKFATTIASVYAVQADIVLLLNMQYNIDIVLLLNPTVHRYPVLHGIYKYFSNKKSVMLGTKYTLFF
mgnify:CR=1 FL=1